MRALGNFCLSALGHIAHHYCNWLKSVFDKNCGVSPTFNPIHGVNALFYACRNDFDHDYFLYLIEEVKLDCTQIFKAIEKTDNGHEFRGFNLALAAAYGNGLEKLEYLSKILPESLKIKDVVGDGILAVSNFAMGNKKETRDEKSNLNVVKFLVEDCGFELYEQPKNKTTEENTVSKKLSKFESVFPVVPETLDYYVSHDKTILEYFNTEQFTKTKFHEALSNNQVLMKHMVDSGYLNFRKMYDAGKPLFQSAASHGNYEMLTYLFSLDQHLVSQTGGELAAALNSGNVSLNTIKFLVETCGLKSKLMARDDDGVSVLMDACACDDVRVIDYLFHQNRKSVVLRDDTNWSALTHACKVGFT